MQSRQSIKSRLKAVKNIGQITKAMELSAAAKMRKSQQIALATRPYAFKALELLAKMRKLAPAEFLPLTSPKSVKTTLLVVIASDRGLAGSFNAQVFRAAENLLTPDKVYVAVGRKAEKFIRKKNLPLLKSFHGFGDFIEFKEIMPLSNFIINGFKQGKWDKVFTISMHFRTALKQEPISQQILPVDFEKIKETIEAIVPEYGRYSELKDKRYNLQALNNIDYLFEPSAKEVLGVLLPQLVEMQIYHLVLEANASEHSARRVAMKSASDSAQELSDLLTIQYNKARQAEITRELVEISATQSALN